VVEDMTRHPLKRMLDLGLHATINSDDPAYFGGYVGDNYRAVASSLGLTREELVLLARNSFTGSFLDEERVALHLQAIDAYVAADA
jgi:adenosine deaminase